MTSAIDHSHFVVPDWQVLEYFLFRDVFDDVFQNFQPFVVRCHLLANAGHCVLAGQIQRPNQWDIEPKG